MLATILLPDLIVPDRGAQKAPAGGAEETVYRLESMIRGSTISRLLFIFPLRVFYEASAAVDLKAIPQKDGSVCFTYAGVPRAAHVMRTLGFSGKTLALLTVGADADDSGAFADGILSRWQAQTPEFSERVKTFKRFPHRLLEQGPQSFAFERDASGFYRDFLVKLEPRYRHYPSKTGIYFNVFPMLAEMLRLLNHRFLPAGAGKGAAAPFPAEWEGDAIDLSADLNRVAGLLEKAVKSLVTVEQKFPIRLRFRIVSSHADGIEICGESRPNVPLWKGFMIRELFRRVRLQPEDWKMLSDEISIRISNAKGQGGFGRLLLKRLDPREDGQ
jgi:hypothetical protein